MERLKSELLQEIDFLLITIAKSTLLLKSVYKKLYITVITHFVFIVFYSIATVYFTFLITTKTLYVLFLVAQIVMQICLIAYYQQQKKISNKYCTIYQEGYEAWCTLSDKIDWGVLRKKFYYKENREVYLVMNEFYREFERPFSPVKIHNNYYKILTLVLVLTRVSVLVYAMLLMTKCRF